MKKYLYTCFMLLLPVLLWNIVFVNRLPEVYTNKAIWDDIPSWLMLSEHALRMVVFMAPLFLKISFKLKTQKAGLALYLIGLLLYFLSWIWQIYFPQSSWSTSLMGYMAPAYTTMFFFLGIGLIGRQSIMNIPKPGTVYIAISLLFVIVHSCHAYLAYQNI